MSNWYHAEKIVSKRYICGHCGNDIASDEGYRRLRPGTNSSVASIYICHMCQGPTHFDLNGSQAPGSMYGYPVTGIDDEQIASLYNEAKACISVNAFTASILSCRKILMHIAVEKGASEGKKFVEYVEHLSTAHYIPPDAKGWVDHIRQVGNEANHEIKLGTQADAKELVDFVGMLLKVIYEFPSNLKKKKNAAES